MIRKLLLGAVLMSSASFAQVVNTFPYVEDFEGETTTATNCGNPHTMSSLGWTNDLGDSGQDWLADNNGTGSTNTGPTANGGADFNPGVAGGIYMVVETSGGCGDNVSEVNLESPWFDLTAITSGEMSFMYHLYGADMATALMHVDVRTTLGGGGAFTNDVIPAWTDNQDVWQQASVDLGANLLTGEDSVQFRIRFKVGASFGSDAAIDDFQVYETVFDASISGITNNACFGQNTGAMTANTIYGVPPYSFNWNNGDTTATISGLAAGEYCCTVVDGNMDTVIVCDTIFDLGTSALNINAHAVNEWICTDSMGILVIDSITGGTPGLPMCGSLGLGCGGVEDTLQSDVSDATNGTTTYPCPLGNWYWGNRHQMAYTPTELMAAGVQPGNISGLGFEIQSLGTSATTIDNFTIYLGCASDSVMTGYMPTTEVRAASTENLVAGWNYYTFDTPFYWDGTSVLIVETCLNNTSFTENVIMSNVNTAYTSCVYYRSDLTGNCGNPAITGTATQRPVIDFINCGFPATPTYFYSWNNGSSMDSTVVAAGTYTLTVTDDIGCVDSSTVIMINESAPVNLDDATICETNPNTYSATPGFDTYLWNTGETTADINITTGGVFYVDATDSLGCPSSDTATVIALPPPTLSHTTDDELFGNDGAIYLTIYGNAFPFIVDWDTDGTGDNDDTWSQFGLAGGTYNVTVTDTNGCFSTLAVTVDTQLGIEDNELGFVVYPNPTAGELNIQFAEISGNTVVEILDLQGKVVNAPKVVLNNVMTLDMSNLPDGVYFVRVIRDNVTNEVKIVKQ